MRSVILIPTYQNLGTLAKILAELSDHQQSVILVDDGSTDGTAQWLEEWTRMHQDCSVLSLKANQGKGSALALGLSEATRRGFDCAVTMDADGQHLVADALWLGTLLAPNMMLIGTRDESASDYPATSLFGRRLWSLGVRALTGLGISDPVCGLRVYPLPISSTIRCRSGRFAWEEEFLIRAAWKGVIIDERPVATIYLPVASRVSHYNLRRDWGESLLVFLKLAVTALLFRVPNVNRSQPLRRSDRSQRRLIAITVLVGGICGCFTPIASAAPILAWMAWKLHACWPLALVSLLWGMAIMRVVSILCSG